MKLTLTLLLLALAGPLLGQQPRVGETVRDAQGNLVYASCNCPPQYRSQVEHKAFLFWIWNRGDRQQKPPATDPAVLQALQQLQANQSRLIELIAAMGKPSAPATDPALLALLQRQSQPQQAPPQIIIIDGTPRQQLQPDPKPRQDLQPEPRPRQDLQPEPRPRQDLQPDPRPRQDLTPDPLPRQDLSKPNPTPVPGAGKPLTPPRGEPKGPPTGYQELTRSRPYTTAVWR